MFKEEKEEDYEEALPEQKTAVKGWGDWAGAGAIKTKK